MPTINSVNVKITGDESGLKKATSEAQKDIGKVGTSALSLGKIAIGTSLGQMLTSVVGKAIRTVTAEMDGAISRLDTINNYAKVMGNLGIGADDSAKSIDYLQEHLLGLPTSLNDAALAVQRFASVNKDIKASTVGFLALNNALLAGGASMDTQATALEQIAQAYSKGKPDAMEWRAMLTAMPAQMNQIAQAAGYASAVLGGDFYEAIQSGKFSMNDFMATIVRLNSEGINGFANFEDQARNATGGVQTSIANLKNSIQRGLATIMDAIGQANIAGFINGIASAIGTVANYIAAFVRLIKEAVAWLGVLFGFKTGGAKATATATKDTATNLGAGAQNAKNLAGGLGSATKEAKKLNNQLASFDEMNVLRETTAGGSGGGAGGGGAGAVGAGSFAVPEIDWGTDNSKKNEKEIERILEKLRKAFDKFAKFLKPIAEVIADIWKSYLAPFFGWVGNDLLPAFFNAVGGALEFLGAIIGSVWSKLKPFIDNFLVPIAQWTGGVIVSVLNAIGDALSWLAGQAEVVDLFSSLAMAIGVATAALVAWNAAASFFNTINLGLGGKLAELPVLLTNTKIGLAGATAGMNAANTAMSVASGTTKIFGMQLGTLSGALSSGVVQLGAIALAITAAVTLIELIKTKTMEAEAAERLQITATEQQTQAINWNSEAIQRQIDLKNELKDIETQLANAELDLLNAQEATAAAQSSAESIAKKYGMTMQEATDYVKGLDLSSENLTAKDRELARAVYELEAAQGRQREANNKVTESINQQEAATEELGNQQWKEIATQKESEIAAMLAENRYQDVEQALIDLANSTGEYQLANGEMVKFTKQDMESMADFIGYQMSQINTDSGRAWNQIWQTAEESTGKLEGAVNRTVDNMKKDGVEGGKNFAAGVGSGVKQGQDGAVRATNGLGNIIFNSFKKVLGIHSPSKVMAEAGRYIVEGVETGMEKEENSLLQTTTGIGKAMTAAFNASAQLPDLTTGDISDKMDKIATKAQANLTVNADNTAGAIDKLATAIIAMQEDKQPIVVKVGEDTLIDTVVQGINNASEMRNRGVINI